MSNVITPEVLAEMAKMDPMSKYVFCTRNLGMTHETALAEMKKSTVALAGQAIGAYCATKHQLLENPTRRSWFVATLTNVGMTANVGCSAQRYINSMYKSGKELQKGAAQVVEATQPQGQPCPA